MCSYVPVWWRCPAVFPHVEFPMSPPVFVRSRAAVAADRQPTPRTRPFALPEVRWASVATVLFVLGLAAQFGGATAWM